MYHNKRMFRWLAVFLFLFPLYGFSASTPFHSMVVFGDSLSDVGNTTHLLKSLRNEENPAYLVTPLKFFVLNKMVDFAEEYYVPQAVLDAGMDMVKDFFDNDLAPFLGNLIGKIKLIPVLPGDPYWKFHFSNGLVWNEYLAKMAFIKKSDKSAYINRAFGGGWAATYDYQLTVWNLIRHPITTLKTLIVGKLIPPSLGISVQAYLLEYRKLDAKTVYFVYSGGNDYLNMLHFEDNYNPVVMSSYVDNVVGSIETAIVRLMNAGARRFVIMGIPHIGDAPKFVRTSDRGILNVATDWHNERLEAKLAVLKTSYPDSDFLFVDTSVFQERARANPQDYGLDNVLDSCTDATFGMFRNEPAGSPFANNMVLQYAQMMQRQYAGFSRGMSQYKVCDTPSRYLFWDEIHPSTRSHRFLAFEICTAMQGHGYEITCQKPLGTKS